MREGFSFSSRERTRKLLLVLFPDLGGIAEDRLGLQADRKLLPSRS
ncbi:MAG: hypothetical protein M0C28_17195 [Candidatus Moduliflexus flocculans]|nr:hypothetical protein [Candidatus Moduliflexus flocculans]